MSHKNYSKFSENTNTTETTIVNEAVTTVATVGEPVVIEADSVEIPEVVTQGYLSVESEVVDSTGNTVEDVEGESIEAPETEEPKVEAPKTEEPEVTDEPKTTLKAIGIVSGCNKLNVRAEASKDSDVLTVISAGTEVTIEDDAEDDFYKVCTGDNKIGYCMKKFIVIK